MIGFTAIVVPVFLTSRDIMGQGIVGIVATCSQGGNLNAAAKAVAFALHVPRHLPPKADKQTANMLKIDLR